MQAVNGLRGDVDGTVETKRDVGLLEVVVDGLGQAEDVDAELGEPVGGRLGAVAAEADEAIEAEFAVVGDDDGGLVAGDVGGLVLGERLFAGRALSAALE